MGYRLYITKIKTSDICFGKLFGYVDDDTKLKSFNWLLQHKYINGDDDFAYNCEGNIVLRGYELKEFLKCYIEDLEANDKYGSIELINNIKEYIKEIDIDENRYRRYLLD